MTKSDTERSLLGAMLASQDAVDDAMGERVTTFAFTVPGHRHIFQAIVDLWTADIDATPAAVRDELVRVGMLEAAGGVTYLSDLAANGAPASSARQLAAEIHG